MGLTWEVLGVGVLAAAVFALVAHLIARLATRGVTSYQRSPAVRGRWEMVGGAVGLTDVVLLAVWMFASPWGDQTAPSGCEGKVKAAAHTNSDITGEPVSDNLDREAAAYCKAGSDR